MTQHRKKRTILEMGHDAFLDIVANLVGILIILVVILGAQSTAVIQEMQDQVEEENQNESTLASESQISELATYSMRAASAQADSSRLENTIREYDSKILRRKRQRAILLDLLAQAEAAWAEKKTDFDKRTLQDAQRVTEFKSAQKQLDQLVGTRQHLENQPAPVVAIDHLPTPMAKTVFGDEIHFRLKGNRLSVVPIQQLLEEIKRDFERMAAGARNGQTEAAVGPMRGFVAKYRMEKAREMISRGGQLQMATRIQLTGMTVEPLQTPHGQTLDQILSNRSELDIELAGRDPNSTTITVWVYPNSFAAFRKLKEHLYARGFATAARPLPLGQEITGGPQGSRSRAQ
jgi:cell division protein FtsB